MAKRIPTGIEDRNGIEVYTGDFVTMHYFSMGIGENYGVREVECEVPGKVKVHWYSKKKERHFCVEDMDGVRYPFYLMQDPGEEIEIIRRK